jgi:hypothetical protein
MVFNNIFIFYLLNIHIDSFSTVPAIDVLCRMTEKEVMCVMCVLISVMYAPVLDVMCRMTERRCLDLFIIIIIIMILVVITITVIIIILIHSLTVIYLLLKIIIIINIIVYLFSWRLLVFDLINQ